MQSVSAGHRRALLRFLTFTRRDSSKSAIDIQYNFLSPRGRREVHNVYVSVILSLFDIYIIIIGIIKNQCRIDAVDFIITHPAFVYEVLHLRYTREGAKKRRRQLPTCLSLTLLIYYYKRQGTIIHYSTITLLRSQLETIKINYIIYKRSFTHR